MVKFRFFKCNNFQFIKTLYTKSQANEKKTSDMGYMGFLRFFKGANCNNKLNIES